MIQIKIRNAFYFIFFNFDKRIRGEQYDEKMLYMPPECIPSKHLKRYTKFDTLFKKIENFIDFLTL